jgi:crotonobetainyl-CoA:carnitine CoA-transferase CaiB-like acyl-CoA transferase
MWHRFGFMDHLCAMSSVAAVLTALLQRDTTGRATDSAASLLGAGVLTNSETYRRADGTLAEFAVLDHEQTTVAPGRRIVECADGWVAISADGDQVAAMCAALGAGSPDDVPAAVRARSAVEVLDLLRAASVPSTEVRRGQRFPFFDDPEHVAAGLVATYRHSEWGKLEQPGAMWWFGDQDVRLDRAPALLGEHTVEVLREIGMDQPAIDALLESGAAVDRG